MATPAAFLTIATQARRVYTETLARGMPALAQGVFDGARLLVERPAEPGVALRRRELLGALHKSADGWQRAVSAGLKRALNQGVSVTRTAELPLAPSGAGMAPLALVDDDTIERDILISRLALAIMDRASWEFTDLRSRIAHLEQRAELEPHDLLRAHVFAKIVVDAWRGANLRLDGWRDLQSVIHEEFAVLAEEAYHEANSWLVGQRVLPEVDLRPFIRRTRSGPIAPSGYHGGMDTTSVPPRTGMTPPGGADAAGDAGNGGAGRPGAARGQVGEETRMMTRAAALPRGGEHAEAVLGRLNKLVGRHVPAFAASTRPQPISPKLARAIDAAQQGIAQRVVRQTVQGEVLVTTPALMQELHSRKQQLKTAAATPEERATIEIVALLFQSILTEERIPAAVRVWFARLQMPVLRVAVSEPDFFATVDHPARRLIDRMGACVMGFDSATQGVGDALEKEIKRIVQIVEAYPDTGRRVFQTVLTEFEKFLEHYLKNQNEATRKAVSLAQQVEQRETLAIQYTIELRRMLDGVPVQDGVRHFLFQIWADVLATASVRFGVGSEQTKQMKRAAADLIWSASAKVTREERAEVIRRLPPLLKSLRDGMASAGIEPAKQDDQIKQLNNSLAAAFSAKAAVIPHERLQELMERLETLEELLPDADDVQIDESVVLDISGHESSELEVVTEGGSMPSQAMMAWARELQVGSWYMLDYRGRNDAVQLAWQGLRKQLSLFVTAQGRCVLFPLQKLAAFLQAGLLLPAQDEALTVRATRSALAKLDIEPSRLLQ
jgi:hypothetical protein